MEELFDLNKNNKPMQVNNYYYGSVTIIQASDNSIVKIETLTGEKKGVIGKIVKAISTLATTAMLLFR